MPVTRIIMVHGIGNSKDASFADSWKAEILAQFPELKDKVKFIPFYWEDLLEQAAAKWPPVDNGFKSVLDQFGLTALKEVLDAKGFAVASSYAMDVVSYIGIPDATVYYQNECALRMSALAEGKESETLIIAHSLGAAMIPHLLWRIRQNTGAIPFHSLILLASPLGFASPIEWALGDFLEVMGRLSGTHRAATLRSFALAWSRIGDKRLHFISNTNDIVCHDARFNVAGKIVDIIPIPQGFTDEEVAMLQDANEGCHHQVTFGGGEISCIGDNHDVVAYIRQPIFKDILKGLLHA